MRQSRRLQGVAICSFSRPGCGSNQWLFRVLPVGGPWPEGLAHWHVAGMTLTGGVHVRGVLLYLVQMLVSRSYGLWQYRSPRQLHDASGMSVTFVHPGPFLCRTVLTSRSLGAREGIRKTPVHLGHWSFPLVLSLRRHAGSVRWCNAGRPTNWYGAKRSPPPHTKKPPTEVGGFRCTPYGI